MFKPSKKWISQKVRVNSPNSPNTPKINQKNEINKN